MGAVSRYGPSLALMVVIFLLSAQSGENPDLAPWEIALRKLGHMVGYAGLFLLWWRALPGHPPHVAAAIAVAYAVTDEYHQTFVDGRTGTVRDVLIDALGVGVAWVTWPWLHRFRERWRG